MLVSPQPSSPPSPRFLSLRFPAVFCCMPSSGCCLEQSRSGTGSRQRRPSRGGRAPAARGAAAGRVPLHKPLSGRRAVFHSCLQSASAVRQRVKQACGLLSVRLIAAASSRVCADREPQCGVLVRLALVLQLRGCPRAPGRHGAHAPSPQCPEALLRLCAVRPWPGP